MRVVVVILIVLVVLAGAAWLWTEHRHTKEWLEVEKALNRLEAGMDHEAKLQLRSTLANAAAAIADYEKVGDSRSKEPRVLSAERAIEHLSYALEQSGTDEGLAALSPVKYEDWAQHGVFKLSADQVSVICGSGVGQIFGVDRVRREARETPYIMFEAGVRDAHIRQARAAIADARNNVLAVVTPVNGDQEKSRCQKQAKEETERELAEIAAKAAAGRAKAAAARAKAEAHRRAFPLHVDLRAQYYAEKTLVWIDGRRWQYDFHEGQEEHIDAKESVEVEASGITTVEIVVNGTTWPSEKWERVAGVPGRRRTKITVADARLVVEGQPN